ncbi:DNA-3-methyladenine glycosylase I [Jannaschia donghaensis]|uniref:DNA-3-methyladenine glycosylase I n=1 Tax=Jannaschia donghaensis TaxID=420998 RepID=A0A0M6YGK3_9RHOB|nr:DNA-3-methyladenine glycosylase I [Jannaschia donghaensis]CTQ48613.1 DNA-3-methyladenine glycosylase 1 [Jannaschia donghaensis]
MERCGWVGDDPLYVAYHDTEWGVPQRDPRALWEQLMLEGFQAGLSWITILRKRENFRTAFANFDPEIIARWGAPEVQRLLGDAGIIRHRGKIEATIGNARAFLDMRDGPGFDAFIWDRVDGTPQHNRPATLADVPAQTPLSVGLSKDLKKAGFRFCGPTTVYAFLQAAGVVNDHVVTCHRHDAVAQMSGPGG